MLELDKIYFQDCLEGMKLIEDKSVDFICTDLPFGIIAPKWDKILNFTQLWVQYKRIIKNNGVIALFASQPFTTQLINSNFNDFRYCWYWIKNQGTNFFHAKRMPIRRLEEICIFGGKRYFPQFSEGHNPTHAAKGCSVGNTYHGKNKRNYEGGVTTRFPTNILEFKCVDNYNRKHSSEKPIALLEYLIKTYSLENELVLDSCAGSGSTLIAARNLNRRYIGFENNLKYFEIARERLGN